MTEKKLAVIILDALDMHNIRQLNLNRINQLYREYGDVLGISTLPHTALSNPMIWGGYDNRDKFWVKEPGMDWTDRKRLLPGYGRGKGRGGEDLEAERLRHRFYLGRSLRGRI